MVSVVELPGQKCETKLKSVIHILKPHGMPYSKMPKNVEILEICHFGLTRKWAAFGGLLLALREWEV